MKYLSAAKGVWVALLLLASVALGAEVVVLKDGSRLVGAITSRTETEIVIRTQSGDLHIAHARVLRIEYPDAEAARVSLKDGTVLVGRIEEQKPEAIVISTAIGILTLATDRIGRIEYGRPAAPVLPEVPGLPKARATADLRASYLAPFGQAAAGMQAGGGGALALWARGSESSFALGLEVGHGGFRSADGRRTLDFYSAHVNVGWKFFSASHRIRLLPFVGLGAANVATTSDLPEDNFVGSYYLDRGDTTGFLLSTMDLSSPALKAAAALYFLPRGDGVGYLLSDRRNLSARRSGISPSGLIGLSLSYVFESNFGIGTTLQAGGVADRGASLGYGGLSVYLSWNF